MSSVIVYDESVLMAAAIGPVEARVDHAVKNIDQVGGLPASRKKGQSGLSSRADGKSDGDRHFFLPFAQLRRRHSLVGLGPYPVSIAMAVEVKVTLIEEPYCVP